jgi:hypothetical protein
VTWQDGVAACAAPVLVSTPAVSALAASSVAAASTRVSDCRFGLRSDPGLGIRIPILLDWVPWAYLVCAVSAYTVGRSVSPARAHEKGTGHHAALPRRSAAVAWMVEAENFTALQLAGPCHAR